MLEGQRPPVTLWTWPALFWPDVVTALAYFPIDAILARRRRAAWTLFPAVLLYVAANVPVARVLSSPLSWNMWRAAGGPLADSILVYLTWENVAAIALVAGSGMGSALALRGRRLPALAAIAAAALALLVAGLAAASSAGPLRGLERNALTILLETAAPRIGDAAAPRIGDAAAAAPRAPAAVSSAGAVRREIPRPRAETGLNADRGGEGPEPSPLAPLAGAARGRHVVLVVLESTAARYLRPWGATEDPMPFLGRLAASSALFESAYCVYPESVKSLIALLCSRYPAVDTSAEDYRTVTTPSLARVLGERGYRTALFHSGRFLYLGMRALIENRGFEVLADAGDLGGRRESSFGVEEDATVERLLEWLAGTRKEGGAPTFTVYLPAAGHHPYFTARPGPFSEETEQGMYLNALREADQALEKLVEGLRGLGMYEDSVLLVVGDHGEAFGQHDGNYGHSLFLWEENVRVPLVLAAPGLIVREERIGGMASTIDLAPTVLDLLGVEAPLGYRGQSLLRELSRAAFFFADYSLALLGLRDGRWKAIHELDSGHTALFDLGEDPGETRDVAQRHPRLAEAYRERLRDWAAAERRSVLAGGE
jgi:hypothetical protein